MLMTIKILGLVAKIFSQVAILAGVPAAIIYVVTKGGK